MKIKISPDTSPQQSSSPILKRESPILKREVITPIPRVNSPSASSSPKEGQKSSPSEDLSRKLIQKQLVLLLHSHACLKKDIGSSTEDRPRCPVPNCSMMKDVWFHIKSCKVGSSCVHLHCSSSQKIIAHWKSCQVTECPVCHIVRVKWAQMVIAKESLECIPQKHSINDGNKGSSLGQSTTSLSQQGLGQCQGRLPHTNTMRQGSVDALCAHYNNNPMGSSSLNEGRNTCHDEKSVQLVQQQLHEQWTQQNQNYFAAYQQQNRHYNQNTSLPVVYDLPNHLQFQSHSQQQLNLHPTSSHPQSYPVMSHYYVDNNSTPIMTMTLTKKERRSDDFMSSYSNMPERPRFRVNGFNSSNLNRNYTRHCQCNKCLLTGGSKYRPYGITQHNGQSQYPQFPYQNESRNRMVYFHNAPERIRNRYKNNISNESERLYLPNPNLQDENSIPSATDVRKAYERLGIPCPSDALNRLMATLPGGASFLPLVSNSSDTSSEYGGSESNSSSRRSSEDDGINVDPIEEDCQVSFCLSLVQRLIANKGNRGQSTSAEDSS